VSRQDLEVLLEFEELVRQSLVNKDRDIAVEILERNSAF
jgi:hypothetical protein